MPEKRFIQPIPYKLALAILAIALAGGCSSAKITNTWRDPSFVGPIAFKKTAIIVIHNDGAIRRTAEDELVKQIGPDRAVAGYAILTDDDLKQASTVRAKLLAENIDGAVTMAVVGKKSQTTYVPGSGGYGPMYSYYDYYGRGGAMVGSPGMVVTDNIVSIQTNIYSVNDGKLIWSGTSETFDPSNVTSVIKDIAKAVGQELRKEKLLQ